VALAFQLCRSGYQWERGGWTQRVKDGECGRCTLYCVWKQNNETCWNCSKKVEGDEKEWCRSKMVTRVQKLTAWVLWLKNFAEMLEPHLAEIKHQWESKLWHSEPLACRKLLHITLHWENRRAAAAACRQLQTWLGDIQQTNRWAPSIMWYSHSHT
jgi:hypothetical protein